MNDWADNGDWSENGDWIGVPPTPPPTPSGNRMGDGAIRRSGGSR